MRRNTRESQEELEELQRIIDSQNEDFRIANMRVAYSGGSPFDAHITQIHKDFQDMHDKISKGTDATFGEHTNVFGHKCTNEALCGSASGQVMIKMINNGLSHKDIKVEGGYYTGAGAEFSPAVNKTKDGKPSLLHEYIRLSDGTIIDPSAGQMMNQKNKINQSQRLRVIPPNGPLQKYYQGVYHQSFADMAKQKINYFNKDLKNSPEMKKAFALRKRLGKMRVAINGHFYGDDAKKVKHGDVLTVKKTGDRTHYFKDGVELFHDYYKDVKDGDSLTVHMDSVEGRDIAKLQKTALVRSPDKYKVDKELRHTRVDSNAPLVNKVPFGDEDRNTLRQFQDRQLRDSSYELKNKVYPPKPTQKDRRRIIKAKLQKMAYNFSNNDGGLTNDEARKRVIGKAGVNRKEKIKERDGDPSNPFALSNNDIIKYDEEFSKGIPKPRVQGFSDKYVDTKVTGTTPEGKYKTTDEPVNVNHSIANMRSGTSGLSEKLEELRVNRKIFKETGQDEDFMDMFKRKFGAPYMKDENKSGVEKKLGGFSQGVISNDLARKLAKLQQRIAINYKGNSRGPDFDAIDAFKSKKKYNSGKYESTGKELKLHGYVIARHHPKGIEVSNAGHDTSLTYASIKGLGINARRQNGITKLGDKVIDINSGEFVLVPHKKISSSTIKYTDSKKRIQNRTVSEQSRFRDNVSKRESEEQGREGEVPLSKVNIQPEDQGIINKITGVNSPIGNPIRGVEAHHILPVKYNPKLRNNINNGIMIPKDYHNVITKYNSKKKIPIIQAKLAMLKLRIKYAKSMKLGSHLLIDESGKIIDMGEKDHFDLTREYLGLTPDANGTRADVSDAHVHQMLKENHWIRVQNQSAGQAPHMTYHITEPASQAQLNTIEDITYDYPQFGIQYYMGHDADTAKMGEAVDFKDFKRKHNEAFRGEQKNAEEDKFKEIPITDEHYKKGATFDADTGKEYTNEVLFAKHSKKGEEIHVVSRSNNEGRKQSNVHSYLKGMEKGNRHIGVWTDNDGKEYTDASEVITGNDDKVRAYLEKHNNKSSYSISKENGKIKTRYIENPKYIEKKQ